MGAAVGTIATQADLEALVASVAGLFGEDAGRHDFLTDIGWPAREGHPYYSAMMDDPAGLLLLARDDGQVIGHPAGKVSAPEPGEDRGRRRA